MGLRYCPRAYPRLKKWETNHGEREERGAEGMWGGGAPTTGEGSGEEAMPPPDVFRFLSSKWQVLVRFGS